MIAAIYARKSTEHNDGRLRRQLAPPEVAMLRRWLDSWAGVGIVVDGMIRQGFDLALKPRGSGLGLTICADIASAHHAKLRATNRPGGGALLTVEIPLATPANSSKESHRTGMNARA